jgi:hypothetical protein
VRDTTNLVKLVFRVVDVAAEIRLVVPEGSAASSMHFLVVIRRLAEVDDNNLDPSAAQI